MAYVQLAHAPGAITFAVSISLHMGKVDLEPDYPTHILNLLVQKILAYHPPVYIPCLYLQLIHPIDKLFVMSFFFFELPFTCQSKKTQIQPSIGRVFRPCCL